MAERKKAKIEIAAERKLEVESELAVRDRRVWWGVGVAVGTLLFVTGAYFVHRHTIVGVNLTLFRDINGWSDGWRTFFLGVTVSSSSLWIGVAALLVTFVLKLYQLTWQLAAAIIASFGLGFLGKHFIAQPRPYKLIPDVHARAYETDPSYPSGHVLLVTVIVLTLWPYLPRGWRWLVALLIPLMALSRIYLGVHTPLDVIGGFALGLAVVAAMRVLPEPIRKFFRLD
jgi:membrane-associated phospholipid phosphatase